MAFQLSHLQIGYHRNPVAGPITIDIAKGDLVALMGPNGVGKSTLLATLAGQLVPAAGHLTVAPSTTIAFLPQARTLLASAPVTLREVVSMGLWAKLGSFGRPCRHDKAAIEAAIELVGLADMAARPIGELSGGQIQRALFARLVVQDCDLILLDEPFAALDDESQNNLMRVIRGWHTAGKTVVAAVHDHCIADHFPTWLELSRQGARLTSPNGHQHVATDAGLRVITGGVS